ncbi:MAG: hypothetical protein JSS75_12040 [Bacteroidetes bacterium]|nr:hypothetical protein [Bacteroidota bacterium]
MPQELYQELLDRLAHLRAKRERVAFGIGFWRSVSILSAAALVSITIEWLFHLGIAGRTAVVISFVALTLVCLGMFVLPPLAEMLGLRRRISDEALAARIGSHFGEVEDRLVNVLQLASIAPQARQGIPSFASAAFSSTYSTVRHLDFTKIIDERPLRRSLLFFVVVIASSLGIYFAGGSELSAAANRLIHFRTFYQKPAPFTFVLRPGNTKVLRGDAVHIVVRTTGEQLRTLRLRYREGSGGEFENIELQARIIDSATAPLKQSMTEFAYELHPQHTTEYYVEARDIESEQYTITVLDRPVIKQLSVTLTPPAYTHQKPRTLDDNFGDISTLSGTRASFSVNSSKPLHAASLVYRPLPVQPTDSASQKQTTRDSVITYPMTIDGQHASTTLTLTRPGTYHITLLDDDSVSSEHPIEYAVALTADEPPAIVLLEPEERSELPSSLRVPMLMKIHDDYGFSSLKLGYRIRSSKYLPEQKEYTWTALPLAEYSTQDEEVPYIWNLTPLNPSPEDEIAYVLEVADNDNVTGPHRTRTSEFVVRFPSVEEIFKRADEQSGNAEKTLREIKQDAEELKKKVDEAVNELKQTPTSEIAKKQQDFSMKKGAQEMLKRQDELNNRVADVKKELEKMTDRLNQQQALSPETMEKYMELQNLFKEIKTPELEAAMKKLQDAMKSLDPQAMQQAMKNFQFNEDQFKKSIERTANILKKIKAEQKVDELMKRSDELAKAQEKTSEAEQQAAQNGKQQTPEERSMAERKQQDAKNELDRMKQESKELAQDMKKLPEAMQAPQEMNDAMDALNDPTMSQAMQDAQDAMRQGQHNRASQRSKDAAQKAKNARNKLSQLKQKLSQNERQKAIADLKRLREEMNRLSRAEEALKKQSLGAQPQSNVFRDLADVQADRREELGDAASELFQMAQRSTAITPEMGKTIGQAFNHMQEALDAMSDRNQSGAITHTQGAMTSLNQMSQEAQKAMEAMQQQGNGSCPNPGSNPGGENPGGMGGDGTPGGAGGSAMQQFLSQINQLAASQQALNDKMQGMMGQNGAQSAEQQAMQQQAQLSRLAAEQGAVQKSLQDLAQEQKEAQGGNRKVAEDLQKLADQMQDAITEMRSKGIRPETIQRQERILSKLLQAERSVHERDKEQEREAKSAEDIKRSSPAALDLNSDDAKRAIKEDLLRTNESVYSKDYQTLIKKYLEKLSK